MYIDGIKHVVSDHGRKRFHERYEPRATDRRIIVTCVNYSKAIWRYGTTTDRHPYSADERVLVTVKPDHTGVIWTTHLKSLNLIDLVSPTIERDLHKE